MTESKFGLSPSQLQDLGLLIVTFAELENHINDVLESLRGRATVGQPSIAVARESTGAKIKEIRALSKSHGTAELSALATELKWAMKTVQRARNMLAHGRLLYDAGDRVSFWSQWKLEEMTIADMLGARSKAVYALKVTFHMHCKLIELSAGGIFPITVPPQLPARPN